MPEYSNYLESLDPVVGALAGTEIIGASKDGDAVSLTAQQIADLGGGSGGTVTSVTGTTNRITSTGGTTPVIDIDAAYDSAQLALINAKVVNAINNGATTTAPSEDAVFDALALKADLTALDNYVNEETFATLTFASPTVWACDNRQSPLAKLTATGDFTIDMTNVKSGSQGVLKVTASTASAFTITFDTSFTNVEATTNDSLLTYTFPADNGQFYLLQFICDGTILHWIILDVQSENPLPFARVSIASPQTISNNDSTVFISFTTETYDTAAIWDAGTPTRLTVPGSGNKIATITIRSQWAANATGVRRNLPYLNGASTGDIAQIFGNATAPMNHSTHQLACVGGDYFEILTYQNSGGNLNIDACQVTITFHDR